MADRYYEVPVDVVANGVDQPVTTGRWRVWSKVGIVLSAGLCLVLLSNAARGPSESTPTLKSVDGLLSLSQSLRAVQPVPAVMPDVRSALAPVVRAARPLPAVMPIARSAQAPVVRSMGDGWQVHTSKDGSKVYTIPGHSHLDVRAMSMEKLAVTAIATNNRNNRMRDVTTRAGVESPGDSAVKEKLADELSNMNDEAKATVAKVEGAVKLKVQEMAGVTAPLGFFDPLGFATDVPEGRLLFYREVEIKHGRVAMLASLGLLVAEQFHPLFGGNIDVPSYLAFQQTPLQNFWPAVVAAIFVPEFLQFYSFDFPFQVEPDGYSLKDGWSIRSDRVPGDLGFDPLGLKPKSPTELKEMQTKELNNGRLAMIAAAGMIAQELATGSKLF